MTARSDQTPAVEASQRSTERKRIIAGPVAAMTNILSAPQSVQVEMWRFWMAVLEPYSDDEIRSAFVEVARNGSFVNPKAVVSVIEEKRKEAAMKRAEKEKRERELREMEMERARAIKRGSAEERRKAAEKIMASFAARKKL